MRRLPERLDWLWFCRYDLESELPDHSVLSKARRRWGVELFSQFFQNILSQCVKAGLVEGKIVHIDSSLIRANASIDSLEPAFAVLAQQTYETLEVNSDLPHITDKKIKPETRLSPTDPEARCRIKGSQKVLGYQEHRCVDDAHGIITATETTHAAINEGEKLRALLEQHEANLGTKPSIVAADKAYGHVENYKVLQEENITPCIPHPNPGTKNQEQWTRQDFRYDAQDDCYLCPAGHRLTRQTQKPVGRHEPMYKIGRHVCPRCPLRLNCYTGNYCKRIYRHIDQAIIDWADTRLGPSRRKVLMGRRRSVVEGSFADSTNRHGYKRARWRGRLFVSIQNLLIGAIQNLRKLIHAFDGRKRHLITILAELLTFRGIRWKQILMGICYSPAKMISSPCSL
jgi:IS5 family transposase